MKILYRVTDETAESLAAKFSLPKHELLKTNKTTADKIRRGKIVLIDKKDGVPYVVRPFDTIEKIAAKHDIDANAIREHNGIIEVFLGEIIYIPSKKPKNYSG